MDVNAIKKLIDSLNGHVADALEKAAAFAGTRAHFEVLPEHLLIKLMEGGANGDVEYILHYFNVDQDGVWRLTLESLNKEPAGAQSKPVFSRRLYEWLEKAWLVSKMHYDGDWVTGVSLVDSLLDLAPYLPSREMGEKLVNIEQRLLRENHRKICKDSCERLMPSSTNFTEIPTEQGSKGRSDSVLFDYCEDLTEKAELGQIDPVLGRNDEIRMMVDVLCRRRKNNPLLVGDPGVGKTAVVESLALRIFANLVPEELRNVRLMALDMGLLQAGAGVKGEFEKRLKQVIENVKRADKPIIMFIDEAHTLIGGGGETGMSDAANLLKPALARGELRTIAATTWSEYKLYFERDAALERRFQLIKVEEPSLQAAKLMLSGLKSVYQKHHNILITDDAIEAAVNLSNRYITGRQLPDKAIDVLDTAAARVRVESSSEPASIENEKELIAYLEVRISSLRNELQQGLEVDIQSIELMEQTLSEAKLNLKDKVETRELQLESIKTIEALKQQRQKDEDVSSSLSSRRELLKELNENGNSIYTEVNADSIASVIAEWTGIPVGSMFKDEVLSLIQLEDKLSKSIVGQEVALSRLAQTLRVNKSGVTTNQGPIGVFLLVGPSGVGKTETAIGIAKHLFGGEKFMVTINMSEYQEKHSVSQLKGSPPGYVGFREGGILTEAVRQRPYSVVLLDEVEKAHIDVMNLFYQVFERGFMRDGEGREIDFRNTVFVMTSNLGAQTILDTHFPETELQQIKVGQSEPKDFESINNTIRSPSVDNIIEDIYPELSDHFSDALLARTVVIPYVPLDENVLSIIVKLKLDIIALRLMQQHQMQLRVDNHVIEYIAAQCKSSASGARLVATILEQKILPGIAKAILEFIAEESMPDVLTLSYDESDGLQASFADLTE